MSPAKIILSMTLLALAPAWAQSPVPFYQSSDAVSGMYRSHSAPLAGAFAEHAPQLVQALEKHCAGPSALGVARAAWSRTMLAWEGLAAVAVGPLIERRSQRSVDFQPMRPDLLRRMLARAPRTQEDMVRVGAPAKGLPAIEHLLWVDPVSPGTPACTYALLAAQEVQLEAQSLRTAFDTLTRDPPEGEESAKAFAEFINQWLGGLERLRWAGLEKPLREAATRQAAPDFSRAHSGQTRVAWIASWSALRALAVQVNGGSAPVPGLAAAPIETYLRGRGQLALADRWRDRVMQSDAAMQRADPSDARGVEVAAGALKSLNALMQAEVAQALEVSIGFSSSDGD